MPPLPQKVDFLARPPHISVILLKSQFWIISPMLSFLKYMFKVSIWVFLSMPLDKHTHVIFFLRSANKRGQMTTPQASTQACAGVLQALDHFLLTANMYKDILHLVL